MARVSVVQTKSVCPRCRDPIQPNSEHTVCQRCLTRHHNECWLEAGGCAAYNCGGRLALGAHTAPGPVRPARANVREATPVAPTQPRSGSKVGVLMALGILMMMGVGAAVVLLNKQVRPSRPTRVTKPRTNGPYRTPTPPQRRIEPAPTPPTPTPVNPNTPPQPGASGAQEAPQDHPPSPTPGPGDPNPGPPNRYTPPPALQPLQIGPEVRHTIARTLRRYERRFDACGRSAGLFKPTKIMAQLIISSSGRVTSVTMIATPEQALLSSCIERLLKRIRFSRFRGPLQSVLLPFDFK